MAKNTAHIAPTTPSLLTIDDIGLQINTDRRNAIIYEEFSSQVGCQLIQTTVPTTARNELQNHGNAIIMQLLQQPTSMSFC
jgi:hypothetical protein